ncbi:MAG: DUF1428 domain-containing protein [Rhizobiaceae bacterium]
MAYMDVFVSAVKTENRQAWLDHAKHFDQLFKDAGALEIMECWGDDVPEGTLTSFTMAVKREPDETVTVGWIKWTSKEARDAAWAKLMQLPEMQPGAMEMPYDGKRMIFGGFDVALEM